jgi:Encapsulating protein for peroxidase
MNENAGNADVAWPAEVWQAISDAVTQEVCRVSTTQKVFPTTIFDDDPTELQDELIDFTNNSIKEGRVKQFVEIYQELHITSAQVGKEATDKTCQILSRMAGKTLALAQDVVTFNGRDGNLVGVHEDQIEAAGHGLLGEANPANASDTDPRKVSVPIVVEPLDDPPTAVIFGENVFTAVVLGTEKLVNKGYPCSWALFLPTGVYADTFAPPSRGSLVTTADRIKPLLEGGFIGTGTLPPDRGLLVSLVGHPTCLFIGRQANTEFERKQGRDYIFRAGVRFNFVERDPRSLVLLKFNLPGPE